jgi:pimeloyl-ACP methyl ester carboxylesterase
VAERREPRFGRGAGMSASDTTDVQQIEVLTDARATRVWTGGTGDALLFLHSEEAAGWNPLLDELAKSFTVYAPELAGSEAALATIDGLHDLLVYLLDVLDALGLGAAAVAGESFGAMVAAELAAISSERVSKLVLMAPLGLWDDDVPVPDLYAAPPATLAARLFGDPSGRPAQLWLDGLTDKERSVVRMRAMRTALHFVFPIPEIGLHGRLHRVVAPTLLVWGTHDGVVAPSYAREFADRINGAEVVTIDGGGHLLSSDQTAKVAGVITEFLRAR